MHKEAAKHYRKINPVTNGSSHRLMSDFGLSYKDYDTLLLEQNGVCAICKKAEFAKEHGKVRRLSVDHCHTTGKIRGLLCGNCNHLLGKVYDSAVILRAAAMYLEVADTGFKVSVASAELADAIIAELVAT